MPASETRTTERTSTIDDVGETSATNPGEVPLTPPNPADLKGRPEAPATEDDVGQSSVHGSKIHPLAGGKPQPTATLDDVGESSVASGKVNPLAGGKPRPTASIDDVGESKVQHDYVPPAPPSRPKKKGFFRRLRNFVFTLMVLGAVGFGGGVWYSRINDKFHDFFTEYIPFGEQAVLYIEEMEFKKRFPNALSRTAKPREHDEQVRIPAQSGASWRVADSGETRGRQSSSTSAPKRSSSKSDAEVPSAAAPASKAPEKVASETPKKASVQKPKASAESFKAPDVNEPSKRPPLKPIDLFELPDAKEPVVQELVHMLNGLVLVINADGAQGKYGNTIEKAKAELSKVGGQLRALRDEVERRAAQEVKSKISEFDKAANELVARVEQAMITQEMQWRNEFEGEMQKVRKGYDERMSLLLEREKKVQEEKLQNHLLQQAIALKNSFMDEVKDRVEQERQSRLGKLNELTAAVNDLEKLAVGWNDVVDTNLQTQQLHVGVEAVRAKLENATHPQPFIKELVALKEIAADNATVNAAIASVNPSAYQRGIFTSSQLIDRFRRVASEVRKASLLPDNAGVASHASSWVLSHVMFKKQGLPEGNDVESVLTRTQIFLEEGDLDAAAREMNGLEGWAKTLSKDWMSEVRKVLEVQQALDVSSHLSTAPLTLFANLFFFVRLLLLKPGYKVLGWNKKPVCFICAVR